MRLAIAVFLAGALSVWLIKPIGNPCPDLSRLPQGSSAKSSPSFSPPGSRTCTYTAAGGIQATSKYMPWLDWIVLLLLAGVAAGAVRALVPASGGAREPRAAKEPRALRAAEEPRDPPPAAPTSAERDAAERERARAERDARRNR